MPIHCALIPLALLALLLPGGVAATAQAPQSASGPADVTARLVVRGADSKAAAPFPAAIWLTPLHGAAHPLASPPGGYTLVQKNKQFSPHLLLVPVGSTVHFPNEDPFFHNVFSLFDGRRFNLGLYEAGSTRDVTFSREGVSYIFCNIHPEMSAVVIALATPFSSAADAREQFRIQGVPPGRYDLHVWVEGESQSALDALTRAVQVAPGATDLGAIAVPHAPRRDLPHGNLFGKPYSAPRASTY